jgi:hypothetical protein
VLLFCLVGYIWLGINFFDHEGHADFTVCIFKSITGVPCPSCGITRSVLQILHGNWIDAILINPLGLMVIVILVTIPIWIAADFYLKNASLVYVFKRVETLLRTKAVYLPLLLLCLLNWYWNILKGL